MFRARAPAHALALLLLLPAVAGTASAQPSLGLSDALLVSALRDRDAERLLLLDRAGGIEGARDDLQRVRDDRRDAQRDLLELRVECSERLDEARDDLRGADWRRERLDARDHLLRMRGDCRDDQDDLRDEVRAVEREERRLERALRGVDLGGLDVDEARDDLRGRAALLAELGELDGRCEVREELLRAELDVALGDDERSDLRDELRALRDECGDERRELGDELRDSRRDLRRGTFLENGLFRFGSFF